MTSAFQQKPPVAGGPETKPGADSLGRDPFPDVDHLRQLMRHVFSHREEGRLRAMRGREEMVARWDLEVVVEQWVNELKRLLA